MCRNSRGNSVQAGDGRPHAAHISSRHRFRTERQEGHRAVDRQCQRQNNSRRVNSSHGQLDGAHRMSAVCRRDVAHRNRPSHDLRAKSTAVHEQGSVCRSQTHQSHHRSHENDSRDGHKVVAGPMRKCQQQFAAVPQHPAHTGAHVWRSKVNIDAEPNHLEFVHAKHRQAADPFDVVRTTSLLGRHNCSTHRVDVQRSACRDTPEAAESLV